MPDISAAVRNDLAPGGKVRAGINYGNFILAQKDKSSGESRGVAVDLANELARRLGVPLEIVAYDSVTALGDAAPANAWDIAFLGSDPQREKIMSFSGAYVELDATYLVAATSALKNASEVDRAGLTVTAAARANYELWLARNIKHAKLLSVANNDAAFALLAEGRADALGGLTEALMKLQARLPGSRILEGRFMAVQQSIALPKGKDAGLGFVKSTVEEAKASGLVARAVERTGAKGVKVAPPAK